MGGSGAGRTEAPTIADGAACPVVGTCSECGLVYEWRLVMRPELAGHRWFVETAQNLVTRACFLTTWRALRPWSFWHHVQLEAPVSARRIVRWAVTLAAVLLLALAVPMVVGAVTLAALGTRTAFFGPRVLASRGGTAQRVVGYTPTNFSAITLGSVVGRLRDALTESWAVRQRGVMSGPPTLWFLAGAGVAVPVVLLVLPHTRARAKVQGRHVARAAAYSAVWVVLFCAWGCALLWVEVVFDVFDLLTPPPPRTIGWYPARYNLAEWSMMQGGSTWAAALALGAWMAVHWAFVMLRGWRMRPADALPALVSVAVCSTLAGLAVVYWAGELLMH